MERGERNMTKYPNIQEIKGMVDVVKFLQHYQLGKVREEGNQVLALCPYHEDSNPSFSMQKGTTLFKCWSCQEKGDAIKLIMDFENVKFPDAITKLAGFVGYNESDEAQMEYLRNKWLRHHDQHEEQGIKLKRSERLIQLNWWAKFFFESNFKPSVAYEYLYSRGFTEEDARKFCLGYYDPNAKFIEEAINQGYSREELTIAGFYSEFDGKSYERFKGRLIFPIYNANNEVVAFSGRALTTEQQPKYTATPNSEYYKKGLYLYGLQHVDPWSSIVLVEGNLDCIRLRRHGINAVAQLGTALTTEQCSLLSTLSNENGIVLLYDGDDAGRKTTLANILPLYESGLDVWVATLPSGTDPDSFVMNNGIAPLESLIDNAQMGLKFYKDAFTDRLSEDVLKDALHSAAKIEGDGQRNLFIQQISETFGVSTRLVMAEMKKV